jgi:ethanolamine ammonia-lyase small subunit
MDDATLNRIIETVLAELRSNAAPPVAAKAPAASAGQTAPAPAGGGPATALTIDLPDPAEAAARARPGVAAPKDPDALRALMASTSARIGVGRAGPRYRTPAWLLFQADHAVTQDALYRDVDPKLLDGLGLFAVQTRVTGGKAEYLLRPDLGRQLSDEARRTVAERCVPGANLQIVVGDGLSAAAVEANVRDMLPVLRQGAQAAGLSPGTPFFVQYCRVGVLNDIGEVLRPDVVVLLIGERPGLGRAESLSAYMAYRPKPGDTDADREVVCNIFNNGGTNPLEASAYIIQLAQKMLRHQASGVKLKSM